MLAFWPDILCPVLSELRPNTIVEIGSESGKVTALLIELAEKHGGVVVSVDPAPRFDVEAWRRAHPVAFRCLRQTSLTALPTIERIDAVLIDGDHNWYTVYHELAGIEQRVKALGQPMPIVFLHDIGWPYGRRDLYYDPTTIPEADRQPFERRGIHPASSTLVDRGGINAHLCNAVREGGPRNGVLTAVEDYLSATSEAFQWIRVPAVFGLGILVPDRMQRDRPDVCRLLQPWTDPRVERFVSRLEIARVASAMPPLSSGSEPAP